MLSDSELKRRLKESQEQGDENAIVSGFPRKWAESPLDKPDWDAAGSPIQAASIDLHVGYIYVPGKGVGRLGGEGKGHSSFELETGHSVVVSTLERLNLPSDLAGIVFPPSALSAKGILVANIGHIDPGYRGPLRFTLINMGSSSFALTQGVDLATLMLFNVVGRCQASWLDRKRRTGEEPKKEEIDSLAFDFVDFDKRARKIARTAIGVSGWKWTAIQFGIPILVALGTWWWTINMEVVRDTQNAMRLSAETKSEIADLRIEQAAQRAEMEKRLPKRVGNK